MTFGERLDRLMTVMGVPNIKLAKALNVDPSLISRFRRGLRKPSLDSEYHKAIASHFVSRCSMDYQRVALLELMQLECDVAASDYAFLEDALTRWLSGEGLLKDKVFEGFIRKLSYFEAKRPVERELSAAEGDGPKVQNAQTFFGIEGKREAVIHFLTAVLANEKPCTMLLYSDESMDWLIEDEVFRRKWAVLLAKTLMKGNSIKIIHTVSRDLAEMLAAIENWLPLYFIGTVEPFYYPKYAAGIFRRTMFVAENVVALTSQSMVNKEAYSANILYTDQEMLASLSAEFNHYLKLCKSLMHILSMKDPNAVLRLKTDFEMLEGSGVYRSSALSLATMPEELFRQVITKLEENDSVQQKLLSDFREHREGFLQNLEKNDYTEIITMPDIDDIQTNQVPITFSGVFCGEVVYYTKEQYIAHLQHIIHLLETYEKYNFYSSHNKCSNTLIAKDGVGAIVVKENLPSAVFAFHHPNMLNAMYVYMENEKAKIEKGLKDKLASVKMLRELICLRENEKHSQ